MSHRGKVCDMHQLNYTGSDNNRNIFYSRNYEKMVVTGAKMIINTDFLRQFSPCSSRWKKRFRDWVRL